MLVKEKKVKKMSTKELKNFYVKMKTAAMKDHNHRHVGEKEPLFAEENLYRELEQALIKMSHENEKGRH